MNKQITIYELLGLIKDDKAPKSIKYNNVIYNFDVDCEDYVCEKFPNTINTGYLFCYLFQQHYSPLKEKVTILDEENEFKDIEKCDAGIGMEFNEAAIKYKINQLIRNQKKIIEMVSKDE